MNHSELKRLVGRTIASVEVIQAEYGWTYEQYICIVCADGEKFIIHGGVPDKPNPNVEEMRKAPNYFSAEDIAAKVLADERRRRQYQEDEVRRKRQQLEALKKELGDS